MALDHRCRRQRHADTSIRNNNNEKSKHPSTPSGLPPPPSSLSLVEITQSSLAHAHCLSVSTHQEWRILLRPQGADVGSTQPCGVCRVHDREQVFDEERQGSVDQVCVAQLRCLHRAVSFVVSYHIVSYHIALYHVVLYRILSYHIISHRIVSYRTYGIVSYHVIPYRIVSYRIVSYGIISYGIEICSARHERVV